LKIKTSSLVLAGALFGAAVMPAQANNEAMMDLLKVLRDQGTITAENYELLANAAKADKEYVEAVKVNAEKAESNSSILENLSWAEKIKLKGDVRFRYENEVEDDATTGDKLRIRARVGAYADVNETTKAGIRLATSNGSASATSSNQSLDKEFKNQNMWIDLAYIDWAPTALGGNTNFIFGKMKQPWIKVNDVIWDGDTNPEGMAVTSKFAFEGFNLVPSAGYYALKDNGQGSSITEDQYLLHAQLAVTMGKKDKTKFGISYYGFENGGTDGEANASNSEERMYEFFGESPIPGTPVTLFGSYVYNSNADATGDDDNGFSLGAKTKFGSSWKASYEYRDTGVNAVNSSFDNSDFANDSKGHILKAGYEIDKNFSLGATYFITDSNVTGGEDVDLFQLDLVTKF
jgi:hypothetical protein